MGDSCCSGRRLVTDIDTGEVLCSKCGTVDQSRTTAENSMGRRLFDIDTKEKKSHDSVALKDAVGSRTFIGGKDHKDASGKKVPNDVTKTLLRANFMEKRMSYRKLNRQLASAQKDITVRMDNMGFNNGDVEYAKSILKKLSSKKLVRGRVYREMEAAIVYTIVRNKGVSGTDIKVVSSNFGVSKKLIRRSYNIVNRFLEGSPYAQQKVQGDFPGASGVIGAYLRKSMDAMEIPDDLRPKVEKYASGILNIPGMDVFIAGKSRSGLGSAILYHTFVNNPDLLKYANQKAISTASKVTEVTLRNNYKKFKSFLEYSGKK